MTGLLTTGGGTDPVWAPDGKRLYFMDGAENVLYVDVRDSGGAAIRGRVRGYFTDAGACEDDILSTFAIRQARIDVRDAIGSVRRVEDRPGGPPMKFSSVALLGLAFLAASGCSGSWPSEMDRQPSVPALAEPRPAPEGAIPVGGVEHLESRDDDQDAANPIAKDVQATAHGEQLFATYCAVCHGDDGHGNGRLSKVFPPAPDLRYLTVCNRSDGFIYGTITAGGRAMPSQREGLTSRDRWSLVDYVRKIQSGGCVGAPADQPGGAQ